MYEKMEAWEPLATLLAEGASHAPDKATRLARLLRAAKLFAGPCANPSAAIPLLERAPAHYHLARLELKMGDRARALVELDAATRIDPANPEILRALAELARDDGQLDRAERSYRALLAALRRATGPDEDAAIVRSEVLLELSAVAERQGEQD